MINKTCFKICKQNKRKYLRSFSLLMCQILSAIVDKLEILGRYGVERNFIIDLHNHDNSLKIFLHSTAAQRLVVGYLQRGRSNNTWHFLSTFLTILKGNQGLRNWIWSIKFCHVTSFIYSWGISSNLVQSIIVLWYILKLTNLLEGSIDPRCKIYFFPFGISLPLPVLVGNLYTSPQN